MYTSTPSVLPGLPALLSSHLQQELGERVGRPDHLHNHVRQRRPPSCPLLLLLLLLEAEPMDGVRDGGLLAAVVVRQQVAACLLC